MAGLLLAGCGKREAKVVVGDREQILHFGNLSEPNDLDPAYPDSAQTAYIILSLMEGLVQYDPQTCQPIPAVAQSWEVSADGLTWTFHLRPDARWSNGDPVTAADFVYAERRMLSSGLAAEYAPAFFVLKNGQAYYSGHLTDFSQVGSHAPDDHTLVLQLERPVPYLLKMVCNTVWYPVHQATIEKFGRIDQRGTAWTRPGNYVGNGPFILSEWKPNQFIRVTKSPTYWDRGRVRLREIYFYPIEDLATEEEMFRSGELHVTASIPQEKIPVYQRDPAKRPYLNLAPQYASYYYVFNVAQPPLNDVRVRKALAYAIDREEIVSRVALGGETAANNLTPPDPGGFVAKAAVPHDPEQARHLLAEAGYPGGKGFPRLDIYYNTNSGHQKIAEAIQQMWRRELGIDVTLSNQEAKVWADTLREHHYQIGRYAWIGDYLDPSTFIDTMRSFDGNNFTGWKSAEYDRLADQADHEMDQTKRFALYQRCEQILVDECPIAPIYFYTRANLRRPDIKGFYSNLLDFHPYAHVYLEAPAK